MNPTVLAILELVIFFLTFPFVFMAFNAFDLSKFFKKGFQWQIQILYILGAVIVAYLFTRAIVNLVYLSLEIM